ncbi:MAG: FAD-dependent thymidylate synthase, partial [Coriobacteriaceae bacterium]|nr:FAD-dependent thymidylate synthase [Coriobacteriaceae bacterium]
AADAVFDKAIGEALAAYQKLLAAGVPAEDARYLLPNAAETKSVITMNIRELLHFFTLRCCNRAQWEIHGLADRMLELARPTAPYVFMDAGAPCIREGCPEGRMTCKNPFPKVSRGTEEDG